jgi:hypothetical protein
MEYSCALRGLVVDDRVEHVLHELANGFVVEFPQHLECLVENGVPKPVVEGLQQKLAQSELVQQHVPQLRVQDMRSDLLVKCAAFKGVFIEVWHGFLQLFVLHESVFEVRAEDGSQVA